MCVYVCVCVCVCAGASVVCVCVCARACVRAYNSLYGHFALYKLLNSLLLIISSLTRVTNVRLPAVTSFALDWELKYRDSNVSSLRLLFV